MGKTLVLKVRVREHVGSKDAQRIRCEGRIPVVVYGHREKPLTVAVDAHAFVEGLHHGQRLMDIQIGSKKQKVIVKDLQYDHLGKDIIHADLMRVDVTERVRVEVPVELKGTAKGAHQGGIIEEHTDHLEVECLVTEIPESIVVTVKEMNVGDSIHAGEVELPAGVKLISSADTLLVTCRVVVAVKTTEELEEEAPAAPEVIGEAEEAAKEEGPAEKEQK